MISRHRQTALKLGLFAQSRKFASRTSARAYNGVIELVLSRKGQPNSFNQFLDTRTQLHQAAPFYEIWHGSGYDEPNV